MENRFLPSKNYDVAEIGLYYLPQSNPCERPQIGASDTAYEIFLKSWDPLTIMLHEQFKVMYLNQANRVLAIYEMSSGGPTRTTVDPRPIFTAALLANASRLILAHNHPSGSVKPSQADIRTTKRLAEGAGLLELMVLDHLIITPTAFLSLKDEGLM